MARIRVVGLGSFHGDDQAAWRLVETLHDAANAVALSDPSRLLDYLEGCDKLILIDAWDGGQLPGTILRLSLPDSGLPTDDRAVKPPGSRSLANHGLGVPAVLTLAESLGWLPPTVVLYAVQIQSCEPGQELSPAVSAALPELSRLVRQELGAAP